MEDQERNLALIDSSNIPSRTRPVNWKQTFANIADTYPYGIPHGFQKDAIQNAMDARIGKSKTVKVTFKIINNNLGQFITVQDENTTGLTGLRRTSETDYEDELSEFDRWSKFESMGFTKKDQNSLGARGQGKTIMLSCSNDYEMFYDSITDEEGYRLGGTTTPGNDNRILGDEKWKDSFARKELIKHTNLNPITSQGTRIIITKPTKEAIDYIKNGSLEKAIIETWFIPLLKKQLEVVIDINNKPKNIKLPDNIINLPTNDGHKVKTWILGQDFNETKLPITGQNLKIKKFVAVYYKDEIVDEELRGINIIHNGMKIEADQNSEWSEEYQNRLFGYIEFDKEVDYELRKGLNQNPNHYQLHWTRQLPKGIRNFIKAQLNNFGKKKLGMHEDPRKKEQNRQNNAENRALRKLQQVAPDLDIWGKKKRINPSGPPQPSPETSDFIIRLNNFEWPNQDIAPRVNYGDKISFKLLIKSNVNQDKETKISLAILKGDKVYETLVKNQSKKLVANESYEVGNFDIDINKSNFKLKGIYRIKASLIDSTNGESLSNYTIKMYVEEDPPIKGLLDLNPTEFDKDSPFHHRQWIAHHDGIKNIILYNILHPKFKKVKIDEEQLYEYLLEVLLHGSLFFVLDRPDDETGKADFHPLESEKIISENEINSIPKNTFHHAMGYYQEIQYKLFDE